MLNWKSDYNVKFIQKRRELFGIWIQAKFWKRRNMSNLFWIKRQLFKREMIYLNWLSELISFWWYISHFDIFLLILIIFIDPSHELFDVVKKEERNVEYILNELILKMLINLMIEILMLIDLNWDIILK